MTLTSTSSLEETLNAYIADEFFANMQYKMAKVAAKGKALDYSNKTFEDNGDEEDEHFDEIVEYMQSLGMKAQVNLDEMQINCTTPYVDVHDGDSTAQLVAILISAEKKAIEGYEIGLRNDAIIAEHPELTQFLGEKLNDERGHLKELEDLLSNIEADGATVPQSNETEPTEINAVENLSDVWSNATQNESVEHKIGTRDDILRKIELGEMQADNVLMMLIDFLDEEKISDFVDYEKIFDSSLTREIAKDEENPCKNKFNELIDAGMIDSKPTLEKLLKFLDDETVDSFMSPIDYDYGTVGESTEMFGNYAVGSISSNGISFSKLFSHSIESK